MPETARRNLTPRIARMLRELEDPAAAMAVGDAMEAKLARKKRGPVLPPLALTLPAAARSH